MRTACLVLVTLLSQPIRAGAEWHIRPFVGLTFGGGTTFVDLEQAAGRPNLVYGVTGVLVGEVLGVEADFGRAPGFFQTGRQGLLLSSRATTLTGNVVIALPRRMAEYSLRPYLVAGAGLMQVQIVGRLGALEVASSLPAVDIGGGATGFLSDRVGLNWDVRHFRSVGGRQTRGVSFGDEDLSFWRATMAVALRY